MFTHPDNSTFELIHAERQQRRAMALAIEREKESIINLYNIPAKSKGLIVKQKRKLNTQEQDEKRYKKKILEMDLIKRQFYHQCMGNTYDFTREIYIPLACVDRKANADLILRNQTFSFKSIEDGTSKEFLELEIPDPVTAPMQFRRYTENMICVVNDRIESKLYWFRFINLIHTILDWQLRCWATLSSKEIFQRFEDNELRFWINRYSEKALIWISLHYSQASVLERNQELSIVALVSITRLVFLNIRMKIEPDFEWMKHMESKRYVSWKDSIDNLKKLDDDDDNDKESNNGTKTSRQKFKEYIENKLNKKRDVFASERDIQRDVQKLSELESLSQTHAYLVYEFQEMMSEWRCGLLYSPKINMNEWKMQIRYMDLLISTLMIQQDFLDVQNKLSVTILEQYTRCIHWVKLQIYYFEKAQSKICLIDEDSFHMFDSFIEKNVSYSPESNDRNNFRKLFTEHHLIFNAASEYIQDCPGEDIQNPSAPLVLNRVCEPDFVRFLGIQTQTFDFKQMFEDKMHITNDLIYLFKFSLFFNHRVQRSFLDNYCILNHNLGKSHFILSSTDVGISFARAPIIVFLGGYWMVYHTNQTVYVCVSSMHAVMTWLWIIKWFHNSRLPDGDNYDLIKIIEKILSDKMIHEYSPETTKGHVEWKYVSKYILDNSRNHENDYFNQYLMNRIKNYMKCRKIQFDQFKNVDQIVFETRRKEELEKERKRREREPFQQLLEGKTNIPLIANSDQDMEHIITPNSMLDPFEQLDIPDTESISSFGSQTTGSVYENNQQRFQSAMSELFQSEEEEEDEDDLFGHSENSANVSQLIQCLFK
jgi:hypothetical protein